MKLSMNILPILPISRIQRSFGVLRPQRASCPLAPLQDGALDIAGSPLDYGHWPWALQPIRSLCRGPLSENHSWQLNQVLNQHEGYTRRQPHL